MRKVFCPTPAELLARRKGPAIRAKTKGGGPPQKGNKISPAYEFVEPSDSEEDEEGEEEEEEEVVVEEVKPPRKKKQPSRQAPIAEEEMAPPAATKSASASKKRTTKKEKKVDVAAAAQDEVMMEVSASTTTDDILPWVEHKDPSSGNSYYHNTETDETSWDRPPSKVEVLPHQVEPTEDVRPLHESDVGGLRA